MDEKLQNVVTENTSISNRTDAPRENTQDSLTKFFDPVMDIIRKHGLSEEYRSFSINLDASRKEDILISVHTFMDVKQNSYKNNNGKQEEIKMIRREVEIQFAKQGLCCGRFLKIPSASSFKCIADSNCRRIIPGENYMQEKERRSNIKRMFCLKHFDEFEQEFVVVEKEKLLKIDFEKREYEKVLEKTLEQCSICDKYHHEPCRYLRMYRKEPNFLCCRKNDKDLSNARMEKVQETPLSKHIQQLVTRSHPNYEGIFVREVFAQRTTFLSSQQGTDVKKQFKKAKISPMDYKIRKRMVCVSQKREGIDTMFMLFMVTEYPDTRWCTIDFLDSVPYLFPFEPPTARRGVYGTIIGGYVSYVTKMGYQKIYLHAQPPESFDTYLFQYKPVKQEKTDEQRARELKHFYKTTLEIGIKKKAISSYQNTLELDLEGLSLEEIYSKVSFSDELQNLILTYFKENFHGLKRFNKRKFTSNVVKKLKDSSDETDCYYFISLPTKRNKVNDAVEPEVLNFCFASFENWLRVQCNNELEFASLEQAQYATLFCIRAILEKDECLQENEDKGVWFHPKESKTTPTSTDKDGNPSGCSDTILDATGPDREAPASSSQHTSNVRIDLAKKHDGKRDQHNADQSDFQDIGHEGTVTSQENAQALATQALQSTSSASSARLVEQNPPPNRQYEFSIQEECVVSFLGKGCKGTILKVGARKGDLRGFSVGFRWLYVNMIMFVPYNEQPNLLFKTITEYENFRKRVSPASNVDVCHKTRQTRSQTGESSGANNHHKRKITGLQDAHSSRPMSNGAAKRRRVEDFAVDTSLSTPVNACNDGTECKRDTIESEEIQEDLSEPLV